MEGSRGVRGYGAVRGVWSTPHEILTKKKSTCAPTLVGEWLGGVGGGPSRGKGGLFKL